MYWRLSAEVFLGVCILSDIQIAAFVKAFGLDIWHYVFIKTSPKSAVASIDILAHENQKKVGKKEIRKEIDMKFEEIIVQ